MERKTVKILSIAAISVFLIAAPIAVFYARYEILSDHLEEDLGYDGGTSNAIKHAYAASQLYGAFRVAFKPEEAQSAVMFLGIANEYIERVTKFHRPDSVQEILKDLHNNLAGIIAAEWNEHQAQKRDRLGMILMLAADKILIVSKDQNPFYNDATPLNSDPVGFGWHWIGAYGPQIRNRIEEALE